MSFSLLWPLSSASRFQGRCFLLHSVKNRHHWLTVLQNLRRLSFSGTTRLPPTTTLHLKSLKLRVSATLTFSWAAAGRLIPVCMHYSSLFVCDSPFGGVRLLTWTRTCSQESVWFWGCQLSVSNCSFCFVFSSVLVGLKQVWTKRAHCLPWNMAAFWMMRRLRWALTTCRPDSMLLRAATW